MTRRVLVVAHNHPELHPGGGEIFAYDLFSAYKRAGVQALFLAATNQIHRQPRPGTSFQAVGTASDEVLLWAGHFDRFQMSQTDTYGVVPHVTELLETFRPDVVHLHHLLLIGAEFPALVRRVLPDAKIVLTLHDYYPICAHDGLMVRADTHERCAEASPQRCHGCFPEIAADRFLLREINLKTHLRAIDQFIAPSAFLKQRYVEWGLPEERIKVIPNGRLPVPAAPPRQAADRLRNVFGYFGNLNPWKGVTVLLKACQRLMKDGVDFEVRVHGGAPFQSDAFVEELDRLFAATEGRVVRAGPYDRDDVAALMEAVDWVVMPSVWWENAPLVIQEAQLHGRPVITSGIGGMAEMIEDGRNGLHVRPGDPADLARVMRQCVEQPRLWNKLAGGTAAPPDIDTVASRHLSLFITLLQPAPRIVAA